MKSKTHDGKLTKSESNISTSGPHGIRCSEYYMGLNEVLEILDSINPNPVSLCSTDFAFVINPNGNKKDRYIGIVSNMLELPANGIFSANQVRAIGHLYYKKKVKLEENCNRQGKRGHYAHARTHRHARTLPNPEALGPEIEEGAVNRCTLQALFLLPQGR